MSILSKKFVNFFLFPLTILLAQCSTSADAISCWKGFGAKLEAKIHKLPSSADVPMNASLPELLDEFDTIEFDGTVKGKVRCDFGLNQCMKMECTVDAYSINNIEFNETFVVGDFLTLTQNLQVTKMACASEFACSPSQNRGGFHGHCKSFCCNGDLCNGAMVGWTVGNHFGTFALILAVGILHAFLFNFCFAI